MIKETLIPRFLDYVKVDTTSDPYSKSYPSTDKQLVFAKMLYEECLTMGLTEVTLDEFGYVMATLPATSSKTLPTIGFIAHMDTAPSFSGTDVSPQLHENYDGGSILLNPEQNIILSPEQFPDLKGLVGETLITTDGTTLLGADDKAGIASIMTACEYLLAHPEIEHGKIRIGFTPDEEVGHGVDHFDVTRFGADFAYTIDGSVAGEIQSQSFNAAGATLTFNGVSVHPGSAKDKLKNSILFAYELHAMLPADAVPEKTEGFEGFFFMTNIKGNTEKTVTEYIIRDHDRVAFEAKKALLEKCVATLNERHGAGTVTLEMADSYYNMSEILNAHPEVMALANEAVTNLGLTPVDDPIRGGTDGARLSFMGLPCPNIFTGGYNFHGRFEFAVVSQMVQSCETIVEIARLAASK